MFLDGLPLSLEQHSFQSIIDLTLSLMLYECLKLAGEDWVEWTCSCKECWFRKTPYLCKWHFVHELCTRYHSIFCLPKLSCKTGITYCSCLHTAIFREICKLHTNVYTTLSCILSNAASCSFMHWVLLSQYFDLSTLQLFLARNNPLRQEETCSYVLFRGRWIWNWSYQTELYISNNAREVSMNGLVCPKVHTL